MADRQLSLEEHVTCSICMDLYDDPLALPCMHSFCRRCIQGIVASAMCLKCPECRKDINLGKKGIAGLGRNFQLGAIVSSYKENIENLQGGHESNSRLPVCPVHRLPCQLQCKKCRSPVCLKCVTGDQHSAHGFSINDDTDDIVDSEVEAYCDKHTRRYRIYCKTCQCLICLRCVTAKEHSRHMYSAIESAYENQKMLLEGRLKETEKHQQLTRSQWKSYRDFTQKIQSDAHRKRDQLTSYFSRLKESLERKEMEMKQELENRETKAKAECKRKIDALQTLDRKITNTVDRIKQLLTEDRLQFLNMSASILERENYQSHEALSKPSVMSSAIEDVSLVTCQFEKEVKSIRWDWPKQVPEPSPALEPTAPPGNSIQPVPRPRRQGSQRERQHYQPQSQPYYQQQNTQRQQAVSSDLQIGSPVQRGKHWKAAMEDGGPGHFGTIVQTTVDPHAYMVRWPNGNTGNYTYNPPWKEEIIPP